MANDVLKSECLRILTETLRLGSQIFPHGSGAHGAQKTPQQRSKRVNNCAVRPFFRDLNLDGLSPWSIVAALSGVRKQTFVHVS